jgi:hypothetical protein
LILAWPSACGRTQGGRVPGANHPSFGLPEPVFFGGSAIGGLARSQGPPSQPPFIGQRLLAWPSGGDEPKAFVATDRRRPVRSQPGRHRRRPAAKPLDDVEMNRGSLAGQIRSVAVEDRRGDRDRSVTDGAMASR